jgi:hypothetical protein
VARIPAQTAPRGEGDHRRQAKRHQSKPPTKKFRISTYLNECTERSKANARQNKERAFKWINGAYNHRHQSDPNENVADNESSIHLSSTMNTPTPAS